MTNKQTKNPKPKAGPSHGRTPAHASPGGEAGARSRGLAFGREGCQSLQETSATPRHCTAKPIEVAYGRGLSAGAGGFWVGSGGGGRRDVFWYPFLCPFAVSAVAVRLYSHSLDLCCQKAWAVGVNVPVTRSSFFKGRICTRDPGRVTGGLIAFL